MTGPLAGGTGLKFWSDATVEGRPKVLAVDATRNADGWQTESARRITESLTRRDIPVARDSLVQVGSSNDLAGALSPNDYNAILLFALADKLPDLWQTLQRELADHPKLLAVCTWETANESVANEILSTEPTFAPLAIAQQTPMTGRAAGLFFMKFFAEVDLHSESTNSMTGKMIWFGHSKAREILKRRKYEGTVGLRS